MTIKLEKTPTKEVVGTFANDGHKTIELPTGSTWKVPDEIATHIFQLETKIIAKNKRIKELAQTVLDLSMAMTPISGFTMIALAMQAKGAGEDIGEKLEPQDHIAAITFNAISNIRRPLTNEVEKYQKMNEEHEAQIQKLEEGLVDTMMELHAYRAYSEKEIRAKVGEKIKELKRYDNHQYLHEAQLRFVNKYDYFDSLSVVRDGLVFCATLFDPKSINPSEWPEGKYAYGETPDEALENLAQASAMRPVGE